MKRMALMLTCAALLAGCSDPIEQAVKDRLKDPGSAQFKDKVVYLEYACISVNSKNSYGGYAGFTRYSLQEFGTNNWQVEKTEGECTAATLRARVAALMKGV